jgi:hypothetical protein
MLLTHLLQVLLKFIDSLFPHPLHFVKSDHVSFELLVLRGGGC